jgi:hypothetical protein
MKKYRTLEQFNEILEQNYYGNFESSAKMLIEYGFYASDIKRMFEDYEEEFSWFEPMRMLYTIELATEIRYKHEKI